MKGKRHSPEQIIKKLRDADAMIGAGKTIGQVWQTLGHVCFQPSTG
jgi:putative transposase